MIKFILGTLFGVFVGTMWTALCNIVDDIDELDGWTMNNSDNQEEPEESEDEEWTTTW